MKCCIYKVFGLMTALFSHIAYSQSAVFSKSSADFDLVRGKSLLYLVQEDGRDYLKPFHCQAVVSIVDEQGRLTCQSGIGENWTTMAYRFPGSQTLYFLFAQGDGTIVMDNTYVYRLYTQDGTFIGGDYAKSIPGGMTEFRRAHVRFISVEKPKTPADKDIRGTVPMQLTFFPPLQSYFNEKLGLLTLYNVGTYSSGSYNVDMRLVPGTPKLTFEAIAVSPIK